MVFHSPAVFHQTQGTAVLRRLLTHNTLVEEAAHRSHRSDGNQGRIISGPAKATQPVLLIWGYTLGLLPSVVGPHLLLEPALGKKGRGWHLHALGDFAWVQGSIAALCSKKALVGGAQSKPGCVIAGCVTAGCP